MEDKPNIDAGYWSHVPKRQVTREPVFDFEVEEEAVFTFNILIDEFGNVIDANIDWKLTESTWSILLLKATALAFEMKFNALRRTIQMGEDVEPQEGQIGFVFYDLNLYD